MLPPGFDLGGTSIILHVVCIRPNLLSGQVNMCIDHPNSARSLELSLLLYGYGISSSLPSVLVIPSNIIGVRETSTRKLLRIRRKTSPFGKTKAVVTVYFVDKSGR